MHCSTCGDYGDLVLVRVKKTGVQAVACTECDLLWEGADPAGITADFATNVTAFLELLGLQRSWIELEILSRV